MDVRAPPRVVVAYLAQCLVQEPGRSLEIVLAPPCESRERIGSLGPGGCRGDELLEQRPRGEGLSREREVVGRLELPPARHVGEIGRGERPGELEELRGARGRSAEVDSDGLSAASAR
jgi:hypothetical protein